MRPHTFTVLDLVAVCAVLALVGFSMLLSTSTCNVGQYTDKKLKARADITQLCTALAEYATCHGNVYPSTLEPLVVPNARGYRYLRSAKVPLDPWKRAFVYAPPSAPGEWPRVVSYGADGEPGGDDDIDSETMNGD